MAKPIGLIEGHYDCRSLDQTLPIFTELLAAEVVRRENGTAVVKHPNTDWLLVVHEIGAEAKEKPHTNHYGFRVAHSKEIEAAYEYIDARKSEYAIHHVTKPHESHFAYSVYFREPGGNDLEIEYYNPRAVLHGRKIAEAPWKTLLTEERFPGRGYIPQAMSHGTLECNDQAASRRFYTEVLGLEIVGGGRLSTYIKHPATPWYVVVLPLRTRKLLSPTNRFTLKFGSSAEVEKAHHRFKSSGSSLGVSETRDLEEREGRLSFIFSDLDKNWWEYTS